MAVIFTQGAHNYVTLTMDNHGNIHMWEGMVTPSNHPTMPTYQGQQAPTFIQFESDKEALYEYLTEDERMHLKLGYGINVKTIPDDFLIHE